MTKAPYSCDLHSHTVRSDGEDTPFELIEHAIERGLKVLALTDHDVLPPAEIELPDGSTQDICQYARSRGLCFLRGIEFSCETTIQDVHIVGLGCDWEHPALAREAENVSLSKARSYIETLERLTKRGYPIRLEEVLSFGGQQIDITQLQKKRIFNIMAAKGYAANWSEAKLLVRDDPYLNVEREKPGALHIIELIHQAGGIAILAHPYLIDEAVEWSGEAMDRWAFIERMIAGGLDGIETRYTYNKTTCKDRRPPREIWREVQERVAGRLILSAGSDYHADAKKGTRDPRELGECGLTLDEYLSVPVFSRLYDQNMEGF